MHALKAIRGSHGPSWRMIVELGDYPKAYGVYPGGQSGNPASPLYDSNLDAWAEGEYFELQFLKGLDDNRFETDYSTLTFKKS
jgi:penicillin amidase